MSKMSITKIIAHIWVGMLMVLPMLIVIYISFCTQVDNIPPFESFIIQQNDALIIKPSFVNYKELFTDNLYLMAYATSIKLAIITTLACLIIGYPAAFYIATRTQKVKDLLLISIFIPFFSSLLLRVYIWMIILKKHGIISIFADLLGFEGLDLLNSQTSVIIGMVYCYLPFMILPLVANIEKLNFQIVEAAEDLGASKFTIFFKIIIPMSLSGIISGCAIVFIPSLGEYIIPDLLGGSEITTIGKLIWSEFLLARNWPLANAIAVSLCLMLLIPFTLKRFYRVFR